MANIAISNIDNAAIEREGGKFRDETLTFAATDTFVKGTILARRAVALVPTASAVTGTGNGTVTALSVVAGRTVPLVGAYILRCITAVTNGGVFRLEDPNGQVAAAYIALTVGAGGTTVVKAAGMQFTITDGSTDFAAGDTVTITVAADGTLVPFNPAGAGGEQVPVAVLTYEVSRTGAGTVRIRALVAGEVNKTRLIIDVDGTGANVTNAILDQLRAEGIVGIDVKQLSALDNQ
jgi:hypothetical protein